MSSRLTQTIQQRNARRRPYRTDGDLAAVGSLIRRAWHAVPRFNAWTFPRFDIWAQWRIADAELSDVTGWRDQFAIWEDGVGRVVAAAFIGEAPDDGVIVLQPDCLPLVPDLLDWVGTHGATGIEANESSRDLCALLEQHGYVPGDAWYVPRVKEPEPDQPVTVPPGFRLATLEPADNVRYLDASRAVFGRGGTVEAYRYLHGARSAAPGCGVIAVDDDGEVAAFANVWFDRELSVCELEPVGTRPERRRLGLGTAVTTEVENRVLRRGIRLATVHSWSAAEPATRFYDALGYRPVDRQLVWSLA